jgi:hypothetical protein
MKLKKVKNNPLANAASQECSGDGLKDFLKSGYQKARNLFDVFGGRSFTYSPNVTAFLKANGHAKIQHIWICRTPIASGVEKFINLISLGGLSRAKKEASIDTLFHLFLVMQLSNGIRCIFQKNATVELSRTNGPLPADNKSVTQLVHPTLQEFVDRARRTIGDAHFFRYSSDNLNCQAFVKDCLLANDDLNPGDVPYIMQSAEHLLAKTPWAQRVADTMTHLGATGARALGNGIRRRSAGLDFQSNPSNPMVLRRSPKFYSL